jgi:ribosomal protein L37AE/L43A
MAGYSKENERQNKALKSILKGQTPEERVMVGYEGKKDNTPGDKIDRLSEIMKEARMPWFCPKCDKVMKKRLDNKMWMYYGHCFDCQVDDENHRRI